MTYEDDPDGHLRAILEHHIWATLALIDRCRELSPEQLELSMPGTYGSIHATLDHLVRADGRYQLRLQGEQPGPPAEGSASLDSLRADMDVQARRWRELLDGLDELDPTMPALPDLDPPYPEVEHAAGLFLVQAVHHGQEHRTHVCSILGAHDLEVPELSGWEYVRLLQEGRAGAAASG
jgi:uncharacterized damage-inducible protein DinB